MLDTVSWIPYAVIVQMHSTEHGFALDHRVEICNPDSILSEMSEKERRCKHNKMKK
jgi:hypothetical protein